MISMRKMATKTLIIGPLSRVLGLFLSKYVVGERLNSAKRKSKHYLLSECAGLLIRISEILRLISSPGY